ncbi:MAG: glyoxalase/bleomycin resistance/extradiol dioxygenase family protein [Acidobacteria bacterium]|nr:glyoxalase/bleomycin resistance/extradiol dioxygenase family protein [Acidobacteriota bacterium]
MSIKKLNPYLFFNGTAEKAIALYERALGAETENVARFGDVPGMDAPSEHKGRVMHAVLRLGGGLVMLSDTMPDSPAAAEGNAHVCLDFDNVADMTQRFEALGAGGKVTMPLQDTFWGAKFGTLTDAFGVQWMFNCEHKAGS